MTMVRKNFKPFLQGDLPLVVDGMAKRYGKLPSELLSLELNDFNLNLAIYYKAIMKEREEYKKQMKSSGSSQHKLVPSEFKLGNKTKKVK